MGVRLAAFAAVAALTSGCSFDTSGPGGVDAGVDPGGPDAAWLNLTCLSSGQYAERGGSNSRYLRVDSEQNYDEAYARCAADGAHLVVIDDQAENDFVRDLITASSWIGQDDLTTEGDQLWVDGAPLGFVAYATDQPDDFGAVGEDCIEVRGPDQDQFGLWNDGSCGIDRASVCECSPTFAVPPPPSCMDDPDYDGLEFEGRRYFRGPLSTWSAARTVCVQDGADLVTIGDQPEHDFVASQTGGAGLDIWIGYSDQSTEGAFVWANGAPAGFEGWTDLQPDGLATPEDPNDCVELTDNSGWNDQPCDEENLFLCECDPSGR